MRKQVFFLVLLLFACVSQSGAQQHMQAIPPDPGVIVGRLPNGLTYYIRHNAKPEGQADFYLIHNVGAIEEDTTQIGLAHFLEHMAFNGTGNFPGNSLRDYLERIGVMFGANLNAGTGREHTVYNISNVPLGREGIMDSCLLILHDWSHFITLDPQEVDRERGVIIEELRTGNNAAFRVREALDPVIYNGSKYAWRNVIGNENALRTFSLRELVGFYDKWYRPDRQAIIIVGDFDPGKMERKVIERMSAIPPSPQPLPRPAIEIPDNDIPLVGIAADPELTATTVSIIIKREPVPEEFNDKVPIAEVNMILALITSMGNERLSEITQAPNAPFLGAYMSQDELSSTCDAAIITAMAREGESEKAFGALYTEIEKIRREGFTESEFERACSDLMRAARMRYDNRNDRRNGELAGVYLSNYIKNTPMPAPEVEWAMDSMIISSARLDVVNLMVRQIFTDENQVVAISSPSGPGIAVPAEGTILGIIGQVRDGEIESFSDNMVAGPLIEEQLKGSPVAKTEADRFGATVWTLGNGARVVIKKTDFKADEVLLSVNSHGGLSLLSDEDYPSGELLASLIQLSGAGRFSATQLWKHLSGKAVNVVPSIKEYENGFTGSCSPKDLETMLQLLYLYFVQPRFDATDFSVMIDKYASALANAGNNPSYLTQKHMMDFIYGGNGRRQAISAERLSLARFDAMERIHKQMYRGAGNFTFTLVGNIDPAESGALIEKYIGSIPASKEKLTWRDDGVKSVRGVVSGRFPIAMQTPKTTVMIRFSGPMPYTAGSMLSMNVLSQILRMRYTESVREEKGGTYGVSVDASLRDVPEARYALSAMFDTNPGMAEELSGIITKELVSIAAEGPRPEEMAKVNEYMLKQRQDDLKQNASWLNWIDTYYVNHADITTGFENILASTGAPEIKALAAKILSDGNKATLMMIPAEPEQ